MELRTSLDSCGNTVYWIDGRKVSQQEYEEAFKSLPSRLEDLLNGNSPMLAQGSGWPMRSIALAVHPKQVEKANERNRRLGLASYYEKDGTCVIPTSRERAKLIKAEGMVDYS